jgi:competence protein ComEA
MKRFVSGILLCFGLVLGAHAAVDLNTATQSELESIKGLGPAKAKAIVEYRQKNGPFKSVEDLDKVKGFGLASIKKLSAQLTVSAGKGEKK